MIKNVLVLMATYNGEKYLREQIDSILAQKGVSVNLLVRDDGSTDGTVSILNEYKKNGLLDYYTGPNLGPQHSFMHLLRHAPTAEYYAFADQDDVWLDDKLSTAVTKLETRPDTPSLYFGQTRLVDESLNPMDSVIIKPFLTFGESLVYKFIGGCTMVFNHELRSVIGSKLPSYLRMHDTWIYLIALAVGSRVIFDATPHILYRQHSTNALGQGKGALHEWKLRFQRFTSLKNDRYRQGEQLHELYREAITTDNLALLETFLDGKKGLVKRLKLIFNKDLRCSNRTTQLLFWINLILNKY